jgi:L-asparaginase
MSTPNSPSSFPVVIINTGGTFNKRYQPLTGLLTVANDERTIEELLNSAMPNLDMHLIGIVHKDSLDMTQDDRTSICGTIRNLSPSLNFAPIIIIHGTDTMHETALFLDNAELNRVIIMTGAMRPAEIDPIEASLHLGMTLGFAAASPHPGVYIAMHGRVLPYTQYRKNRALGIFQSS